MLENALVELLRQEYIAQHHKGVYSGSIPEGTELPAISYLVVNDKPINTIDLTGPRQADVQISSVAEQDDQAYTLAKSIRNALPSIKGVHAGINLKSIIENQEIPSADEGSSTFRRIQDYTINYSE
ncbi:tail completion protein gp17 [Pseudoalteromonas sp. S16_S37]|uniref:tail completion protein gp17 n=1 Tax=Pseudoalteromonas sp. S16_S37 TaxID=2720228 RepID=UPI001680BF8E|nr:DUF3168 domain-containing protein [Pseudoalteromonas sp. S16_S37]MBD1583498.1 DUF3168 domain-containing protein [Pseudoalteromonas sp. S16_S37]